MRRIGRGKPFRKQAAKPEKQAASGQNKWVQIRMGLIFGLLACAMSIVIGRVYYLQTDRAENLQEMAASQSSRSVTVQAKRGSILDRNGVEMAVTIEVPSVFVRPQEVEDPKRAARQLLPHIDSDAETLLSRLSSERRFVWLKRQIHPDSAEAIGELGIPGVGITTESKRYYPLQERAGQLLGFVNIDGKGLEGLESAYQSTLAGGKFKIDGMRDARGRTLMMSELPEFEKFQGDSVVLTIDNRVQRVAEKALARQVEEYEAKGGYAVVLDVKTGAVVAMANTPDFDPNHFSDFRSEDWRLRGVTDTFEPGSTFKPFVLAAALEAGTVGLNSEFDTEKGRIKVGRYTIRDTKASEVLNAAEIIQLSSNIGVYKIAKTIGKQGLYDAIRDFGFGSRTGVNLRGEQPGLVWPPDRWAEVSFANIAFGQGLTTTPLQMTAGVAALANGGMLMQPHIIQEIRDKNGEIKEKVEPKLVRRVVSPQSARQTAWAMSLVTREGGTGTRAAMEHFTVAGKTGTAQKVNPETRRYDPNMWTGSFVGFAPAEAPEFAVMVMIDEPQKSHYGGVVAAPAFKEIMQTALNLRGVLPLPEEQRFRFEDEEDEDEEGEEGAAELVGTLPDSGPDILLLPDVEVPSELEAAGEGGVPDFRGLTLRGALQYADELGYLPEVEGWGRVVEQIPAPGAELQPGDSIALVLSPATHGALFAEEPSAGSAL